MTSHVIPGLVLNLRKEHFPGMSAGNYDLVISTAHGVDEQKYKYLASSPSALQQSIMPDQTNWQLPGLNPGLNGNRNALLPLIVAIVFAYSRRANRRRLEDHFHAFWNLVLGHLIHDEPQLMLAPQMSVYLTNEDDLPPGPNVSLDTVAGREEERRPDFIIMGVRLLNFLEGKSTNDYPMFPLDFSEWNDMVFRTATPRAVIELKTPPPRRIDDAAEFTKSLEGRFTDAATDAQAQAMIVFERADYVNMTSLILIIAVGEWWRFRIFTRDEYEDVKQSLEKFSFFEEQEDKEKQQEKKKKKKKKTGAGIRVPAKRTLEEDGRQGGWPYKREPIKLFHEIDDVEPIQSNWNDCKPEPGTFTRNILFGSPQSNQRFYYIHTLLKRLEPAPANFFVSPENSDDELALRAGDFTTPY
ncbi:hypothetical protein LshimejAT787_0705660 [Lyophyllum shimeji]|uniref:Uncharacterized protein n=1 Tax=Lyophyllum shimeji TaxID=47721 RepID=A0A9P3PQS9_LYOSH|nr:hypothetical protein LshimejAT787_0705660 [Lyophyllum shimeji]